MGSQGQQPGFQKFQKFPGGKFNKFQQRPPGKFYPGKFQKNNQGMQNQMENQIVQPNSFPGNPAGKFNKFRKNDKPFQGFQKNIGMHQGGKGFPDKQNLSQPWQNNLQPVGQDNQLKPRDSFHKKKIGPPGANLFIFHVPSQWKEQDFQQLFEPFGNIINSKIVIDKETGQNKGFGFVSYETPDQAANALAKLNGLQILNKKLKVVFRKGEDEKVTQNPNAFQEANQQPLQSGDKPQNQFEQKTETNIITTGFQGYWSSKTMKQDQTEF